MLRWLLRQQEAVSLTQVEAFLGEEKEPRPALVTLLKKAVACIDREAPSHLLWRKGKAPVIAPCLSMVGSKARTRRG